MNKKKNILFVNGHLKTGGVEMSLVNLLNSLDYSKYNVDLLLLQGGYVYEKDLTEKVTLHKVDLDPSEGRFLHALLSNIRHCNWICVIYRILEFLANKISKKSYRWLRLGKALEKEYDVAISFRPGICADIVLYKIKAKKKICWWHHGNTEVGIPDKGLGEQLYQFDNIVAVSHGIAEILAEKFRNLATKIFVIPNIINQKIIIEKAKEYFPYINRENDENYLRIVTVSRLSPEKNIPTIVDVANRLNKEGFRFKWYIVGDGDSYEPIKERIIKTDLESKVYLEGDQINPYPWIEGADLMVHPSTVESFGLVLLESMALGTPCIAVESIGAKELINGKNGILTSNNIESIVKTIKCHENIMCKDFILYQEETVRFYSPESIHKLFNDLIYD